MKRRPECGQLEQEPDDQEALMEAVSITSMVNHAGCFGLIPECQGMPHYTNNNEKKLPLLGDFEASSPSILIIIVIIVMSKIQFLLRIHRKDLFLLPTPAEVEFNTTDS